MLNKKIYRLVYEGYSLTMNWSRFYAQGAAALERGQLVVVYREGEPYMLGIPATFAKVGHFGGKPWRDTDGRHFESLSYLCNVLNGRRLTPEHEGALWAALDAWLGAEGPAPRPARAPKVAKVVAPVKAALPENLTLPLF